MSLSSNQTPQPQQRRRLHLFIGAAVSTFLVVSSSLAVLIAAKRRENEVVVCRITMINTIWPTADKENIGHSTLETGCIPIVDDSDESSSLLPIELPEWIREAHRDAITGGKLLLTVTGATVTKDRVLLSKDASFTPASEIPRHLRHLFEVRSNSFGTKRFMIVRVSATDSEAPSSLHQIEDTLFGTEGPNMRTQFAQCSFGAFQTELVYGIDVRLRHKISHYNSGSEMADEAVKQIEDRLGSRPVRSMADYVLFCMAEGAGEWIASAGTNWWRSHYNSEWCTSLSATSKLV
jgi:hypothetical protein